MSDDRLATTDVTAPSSDAPDTTAPSPSPAPDSPASSSNAPDVTTPSSGDSRQSDRDGLLAAVKKVVETKPEASAIPSDDADADALGPASQDPAATTGSGDPSSPDQPP